MQQLQTIVWFRQDLRLTDNPALSFAAQAGTILPVYIKDNTSTHSRSMGAASKWWLHHSLEKLQKQLDDNLLILEGDPKAILMELCRQYGTDAVVWNRVYEPETMQRDAAIKAELKNNGIKAKSFNGSLLWEPTDVLKKDGTPYKVFTPYYRKGCLTRQSPRFPIGKPEPLQFLEHDELGSTLSSLALLPDIDWDQGFSACWTPGEEGAKQHLQIFRNDALKGYKEQRNIPSVRGTSKLSPHLHFGELSPNQVWYSVKDALPEENSDLDCYLSELGWREFSYYLLFHFPDITTKNFQAKFDNFPWQRDQAWLRAWQKGQTGIPIVDAGMRELWQTGYMHNRVRMIVGSFLVKNLLQDWRDGEAWFWDCLVDADLASNTAGWQWVAGSGADASPYFRIFNPVTQGEKFDPDGEYVKTYCPELQQVPAKVVHKIWEAKPEVLNAVGVTLGTNYPEPIVDLKASRQRALDAFSSIKGSK
ncbi:MAG: cryptochrome/photolyase family protein [Aestuariibacter sp.]